jgi:8-oxo-dGTP diphosphatase
VFVAEAYGTPRAADDARSLQIFRPGDLPPALAFDHGRILADYLKVRDQWLAKLKKT